MSAQAWPDAPKLAWVRENERLLAQVQHEMIMPSRVERLRLHRQLTRHAQVHAQPAATAEFKEHLLPVRVRAEQFRTDDVMFQRMDIATAKHPLAAVHLDAQHGLVPADFPLPGIMKNFREFRHE